jgi:hypothetical protein
METEFAEPAPHVQAFVGQLINAGGMLVSIVDNLAKGLVENGATVEEANADIIVALMGSVANELSSVPEADFVRAATLVERAADAVLADLRRAERLARQRERATGSARRRRGHASRRR